MGFERFVEIYGGELGESKLQGASTWLVYRHVSMEDDKILFSVRINMKFENILRLEDCSDSFR